MSAETAGGSVLIRGGRFVIDDSTILANVTGPSIGAPGTGIDIVVNKDAMIQNAAILETNVLGNATPGVTYGGVTVHAEQVQLNRGGLITAATTGSGNAGSVTINTIDSVTIDGPVSLAAPPLSTRSRIIASTSGSGNGGDVTIKAGQSVSLTGNQSGISTDATSTGNAGLINIDADTLTLTGFAQIGANTLAGSEGDGGNIDVQVRQATLTGGSSIFTNTAGLGDAGSIRIGADEGIALVDSAINSSSFDSGNGAGNAGTRIGSLLPRLPCSRAISSRSPLDLGILGTFSLRREPSPLGPMKPESKVPFQPKHQDPGEAGTSRFADVTVTSGACRRRNHIQVLARSRARHLEMVVQATSMS